ncbi:MAG: hypothetical protein K6G51_00605 [Sphaerochaetaceae bacterium]|nr:hypothetical protein [Sphaerochaetaceae bacterium]
MDILKDNPKKLFTKYFFSSFLGSFIVAIYSIVDSIMIGQYEGALGAAAVACILPVWNVILSLGALVGVGGAVYFSYLIGEGRKREAKEYFTISIILSSLISAITMLLFFFKGDFILTLFGADETLLVYARRYVYSIRIAIPFFIIGNVILPYTRADGKPIIDTVATLLGGIFNMVGDYVLVFVYDMGIFGAGVASALSEVIIQTICIIYVFTHKTELGFVIPRGFIKKTKDILFSGVPSFILDLATGILALSFNNQIMRYYGSDTLAIYSCIGNIVFVLSFSAFAIGQSSQPLISKNLGAGYKDRAKSISREAIKYVFVISLLSFLVTELFPRNLIRVFMKGDLELFSQGEIYMRIYFTSLIFYFFNIYMTYYFQSIFKEKKAIAISVLRSFVFSLLFVFILPLLFGRDAIWFAVPLSELLVFIIALLLLKTEKNN